MSEPVEAAPLDYFTLWSKIPEGVSVIVRDGKVHMHMHKDHINDAWAFLEEMRTLLASSKGPQ